MANTIRAIGERLRLQRWIRPAVVVLSLLSLGLIAPNAAARSAGTLIVMTLLWFLIKQRWPRWTTRWRGAWLFVFGLSAALLFGIVQDGGMIGFALAIATVVVLPPMLLYKSVGLVRQSAPA